MQQLEEIIGYQFVEKNLLKAALSHGSIRANAKEFGKKKDSFERLEFLGDRILGLVIADTLYHKFPKEREGALAKRLSFLVCKDRCVEVAKDICLIEFIRGLDQDVQGRSSALSDCLEALIAAIYLDSRIEEARTFILRYWGKYMDQCTHPQKDSKTTLQEWCQKNNYALPSYRIIGIEGPDHAPIFSVELSLGNGKTFIGLGANKKEAEQQAAEMFLQEMQDKEVPWKKD